MKNSSAQYPICSSNENEQSEEDLLREKAVSGTSETAFIWDTLPYFQIMQ
jgi:hypothetical protein